MEVEDEKTVIEREDQEEKEVEEKMWKWKMEKKVM